MKPAKHYYTEQECFDALHGLLKDINSASVPYGRDEDWRITERKRMAAVALLLQEAADFANDLADLP